MPPDFCRDQDVRFKSLWIGSAAGPSRVQLHASYRPHRRGPDALEPPGSCRLRRAVRCRRLTSRGQTQLLRLHGHPLEVRACLQLAGGDHAHEMTANASPNTPFCEANETSASAHTRGRFGPHRHDDRVETAGHRRSRRAIGHGRLRWASGRCSPASALNRLRHSPYAFCHDYARSSCPPTPAT